MSPDFEISRLMASYLSTRRYARAAPPRILPPLMAWFAGLWPAHLHVCMISCLRQVLNMSLKRPQAQVRPKNGVVRHPLSEIDACPRFRLVAVSAPHGPKAGESGWLMSCFACRYMLE